MRFATRPRPVFPHGRLAYSAENCEFSYRFLRRARRYHLGLLMSRSGSYLLVDLLEVALARDGRLLYVGGYSNYRYWEVTAASPPRFRQAAVHALLEEPLEPGVDVHLDGDGVWRTFVNSLSGWVCLGQPAPSGRVEAVEFASDTVAVLRDGELVALWLHPSGLPVQRITDVPDITAAC
jgi:hypothetical protein